MTRPLILALAAALLCGCISGPVTVHVNARVNVDSNLVAALSATLGGTNGHAIKPSPVVAGVLTTIADALHLPVPAVIGTTGAGLLSLVAGIVAGVLGKRTRKNNKDVVKACEKNNAEVVP